MENNLTEVLNELLDLGKSQGALLDVEDATIQGVIVPDGYRLQTLESLVFNKYQLGPVRKEGTIKVLDAPSFCEYYALFHDENSRVFADETKKTILAILDYHAIGENAARWCAHRLDLTLRHSVEWTRWSSNNKQHKDQTDFAMFLEDNGPDIVDPSAAAMLEVARDLSATNDVQFGSAVRLQNGQVQLNYTENIKGTYGKDRLEIPEMFKILIPVYVGSAPVQLTARLRYRITSGKLTFWYDLLRADTVERTAFLAAHAEIGKTLAITIINGSPA